jgi:hypothetical protein
MTATILLAGGHTCKIDDADLPLVSQFKWRRLGRPSKYQSRYYAICSNYGMSRLLMHRLIMGAPKGMVVDHINRDGLDNRRANLRVCTQSQNRANSVKPPLCSSSFKGVKRWRDGWTAQITVSGKKKHLGVFDAEVVAAQAYDNAAIQYFGEFARLNFPTDHALQAARP